MNLSDNDLCERCEKRCFVPVQCFRLTVVYMFVSVFMLLLLSSLMLCGLDGEINVREYVNVNVIYLDVYNLSVVGVLFVAHLEGVLRLRVWNIRCEMGVDEA